MARLPGQLKEADAAVRPSPHMCFAPSCPAFTSVQRGGETIFSGAVGPDARNLISYFSAIEGVPAIKPRINPANWCAAALLRRCVQGFSYSVPPLAVFLCGHGSLKLRSCAPPPPLYSHTTPLEIKPAFAVGCWR